VGEVRKLSGRIFIRIFLGAFVVFLVYTLVNYLYTKNTIIRLTNNIVERTFRSAYNQIESQVLPILNNAQNTIFYIKKLTADSSDIVELLEETNLQLSQLYASGILIKNLQTGNQDCYYLPNQKNFKNKNLDTSCTPVRWTAHGKTGTYSVLIREDTISLNSFYTDSVFSINLIYDFPLNIFLNTLNREARQLNSRHYLFNNHFESIVSSRETLNTIPSIEQSIDIEHIKKYLYKNKFGYFPTKEFIKNQALYVSKLRGTELILASVMQTDEIVKRIRIFYLITFFITILALALLAYIFQRIIIKLTRPLTELSAIGKKMGKGLMQTSIPENYRDVESAQLSEALRTMQQRMHRYISSLNVTLKEKRALERDLSIAEKIQISMLPPIDGPLDKIPELDIYCAVKPAKGVAGDFYDYFFIDDDRLFFVLGDVSGKGIPASLFMVKTITLLQIEARSGKTPGEIFTAVNDQLTFRNEEGMFVTGICGSINIKTGEAILCDAGHHEPLTNIGSGDYYYTGLKKNMPLGILIGGKPYESTYFNLKIGESFILYSDGLPEAANSSGKMLGNEIIAVELEGCGNKNSSILANRIWSFYNNYTHNTNFNDDVSLFILKFLGEDESSLNSSQ